MFFTGQYKDIVSKKLKLFKQLYIKWVNNNNNNCNEVFNEAFRTILHHVR